MVAPREAQDGGVVGMVWETHTPGRIFVLAYDRGVMARQKKLSREASVVMDRPVSSYLKEEK